MSIRPPRNFSRQLDLNKTGHSVLEYEMLAEQAASLGHAEKLFSKARQKLDQIKPGANNTEEIYQSVADALYAYIIARELCGHKSHDDIYESFDVPPQVRARVGVMKKP